MQEIVTKLIESIEKGNYSVAIIIIFVGLVFNYRSIIEFIDSRKKVKILQLEKILESTKIKGVDRELSESELIKEQFKSTLGLSVEKEFREAIIKAHQHTKGELDFVHFQRALPYLEYENNTLKVHISKFEYIGCILNIISSISICLIGYGLFIYALFHFSWSTFSPIMGLVLLSIFIGFVFLYEIRHIISAKKILKELEHQENKTIY
ncbi:MAG: hypothetical protein COB42_08060 [Sulfurimonas sp.]|nr:MAG: hypothetical protein COB42_08060 [Sulfurimonas sp.]